MNFSCKSSDTLPLAKTPSTKLFFLEQSFLRLLKHFLACSDVKEAAKVPIKNKFLLAKVLINFLKKF